MKETGAENTMKELTHIFNVEESPETGVNLRTRGYTSLFPVIMEILGIIVSLAPFIFTNDYVFLSLYLNKSLFF